MVSDTVESTVLLGYFDTNANTARCGQPSHAAAAGGAAGGARRYGARAVGWDGPESPRLRVRLAAARVPHVRGRAARAGRRHAGRRRGAHAEVHRGGGRLLRARRVRVLPEGIARQVPKWQRRLVLLPWEGRHGVVGGARRRDGGRPRGPRQHLGAGAMRVVERLDGAPARPPRHPCPPASRRRPDTRARALRRRLLAAASYRRRRRRLRGRSRRQGGHRRHRRHRTRRRRRRSRRRRRRSRRRRHGSTRSSRRRRRGRAATT